MHFLQIIAMYNSFVAAVILKCIGNEAVREIYSFMIYADAKVLCDRLILI